jgi:hypothetical protein
MPPGWKPDETLVLTTSPPALEIEPSRLTPENYSSRLAFRVKCNLTPKLRVMLHTEDGRLADSWIVNMESDDAGAPSGYAAAPAGGSATPNREWQPIMLPPGLGDPDMSRANEEGKGYLVIKTEGLGKYRVSTSVHAGRKWVDLYFPAASFIKPEVMERAGNIIGDVLIDRDKNTSETQLSVEIIPEMVGYNVAARGDELILEVVRQQDR